VAQIPDTPDIQAALQTFVNRLPEQWRAVPQSAATRLGVLHQLGGTDEGVKEGLAAERDQARAERNARPTTESFAELKAERDALLAELEPYRNPPPGPFAVPIVQFRAGLIPMRLRLLHSSETIRAKWNVILGELVILSVVYPRQEPVAGLITMAVSDGVLTQSEADALSGR
jgi:hypothetical protein